MVEERSRFVCAIEGAVFLERGEGRVVRDVFVAKVSENEIAGDGEEEHGGVESELREWIEEDEDDGVREGELTG